jgi:hypothetical protein
MVVAGEVEKNSVQIGVKGGFAAKSAGISESEDEGVLDEVLGIRLVAAEKIGRAEQPVPIKADEFLDGGVVSAL